jgi:hypothetical protein
MEFLHFPLHFFRNAEDKNEILTFMLLRDIRKCAAVVLSCDASPDKTHRSSLLFSGKEKCGSEFSSPSRQERHINLTDSSSYKFRVVRIALRLFE